MAGLGTFIYLGIEYSNAIFMNTKQPAGVGEVANLGLYKTLAYIWLAYYLLAVAISAFVKIVPPMPLNELATFAGTVMLAYVAGQKGSKLSVNIGPPIGDFTGNGPSAAGASAGGMNPAWSQPAPQASAGASSTPTVPTTTQPQTTQQTPLAPR
jgi:hypothetical protein